MSDLSVMGGQVAVVTGAGGGIGSAISHRLAEAGAKVVLTYRRSKAQTEAVARNLPGEGHLVVRAPVDDSPSLNKLAAQIASTYGTLDVLINNAGITKPVPHDDLDSLDDDLIDSIFRTNWRGAFASIRALKELLMKGDGGVVINISSIAGVTGIGSNVAYCASKAALNAMTISLGRALAPKIRVVSVSPGWVYGEYAKQADPAYLQEQIDKTPLGRLATHADVAETVLAVITMMPFTTGCIIPVDGGRPFV